MATRSKDRALFGGGGRGKGQEERPQKSDRELTDELDQLEKDIHELRATYELYFRGVEKIEPAAQRDLIKAALRRWVQNRSVNTGIKFRVQQLKARMISLENYWKRTVRQKEAGTYRPDLLRVKRREAERLQREEFARKTRAVQEGAAPASDIAATGSVVGGGGEGHSITGAALADGRSAARTAGNPASAGPNSGSAGRPRARSAEDLTEPKLRKLYQTYVGARRRCGEKIDLRYEEMAAALRKQVPKLIKKTGANSVEFKVVIRSGRAVLKALPKHGGEK